MYNGTYKVHYQWHNDATRVGNNKVANRDGYKCMSVFLCLYAVHVALSSTNWTGWSVWMWYGVGVLCFCTRHLVHSAYSRLLWIFAERKKRSKKKISSLSHRCVISGWFVQSASSAHRSLFAFSYIVRISIWYLQQQQ